MGLPKADDNIAVPSFRVGIFLLHEGNATKPISQSGVEIAIGQIAFQSRSLLALTIEQKHGRRPDRTEAVEPCRVFFNVSFYRKEIFGDELGSVLIFIGLGIQPSTGSSSRSRAEIHQDRPRLLLGCG
jgi:hypothetical protein